MRINTLTYILIHTNLHVKFLKLSSKVDDLIVHLKIVYLIFYWNFFTESVLKYICTLKKILKKYKDTEESEVLKSYT